MIKVGEVLQELVDESGRTSTEIAKEMGISRQSLYQYINRNPEKLKMETFQTIIETLGYEVKIVKKGDERT